MVETGLCALVAIILIFGLSLLLSTSTNQKVEGTKGAENKEEVRIEKIAEPEVKTKEIIFIKGVLLYGSESKSSLCFCFILDDGPPKEYHYVSRRQTKIIADVPKHKNSYIAVSDNILKEVHLRDLNEIRDMG